VVRVGILTICDLHFHTNIHKKTKNDRILWLQEQLKSIANSGLDFLASTEHVYKDALDSYIHLKDTVKDLKVTIIPGVEWISSEKIEIIFLFDSEGALKEALKTLKPFSHSVWDLEKLKNATGSITIIPHPFTPGKTGAANRLGLAGFEKLLETADYVEIHNGLTRQFREFFFFGAFKHFYPRLNQKLKHTAYLPDRYRLESLGWSIGSDAHFPGELYAAGYTDQIDPENWFESLKNRLHFSKVDLPGQEAISSRLNRNFKSLFLVMQEAWLKARFKKDEIKED
jgi:hypothetical protein